MYRGRYFNRTALNVCGDYMDGDIYPVYQSAGVRRKRCKPTSEIQEKLNQKNAAKHLTRLVRKNFSEADLALHLTYRDGERPDTPEQAAKDLANYIRRLKRRYKKISLELKYISCTEYGKKGGRCHHHLIVSGGLDRDALESTWGKGYANSKRLQFEEDGMAALSHYMAKDAIFFKRWNASRNLIQPEPEIRDNQYNMGQMEEMREAIESNNAHAYFESLYPGWELIEASCTQNGVNRGWYISFEMRRIKQGQNRRR